MSTKPKSMAWNGFMSFLWVNVSGFLIFIYLIEAKPKFWLDKVEYVWLMSLGVFLFGIWARFLGSAKPWWRSAGAVFFLMLSVPAAAFWIFGHIGIAGENAGLWVM